MDMRNPLVSLGLPVYNGQRYLREAAESILAQTFLDFELIICDNASTDDTQAICESLAATDKRVRYVRNPVNIGAAPNFNKTFELSTGQYFKWVAHDDRHAPIYLEQAVAVLQQQPEISLVHSRVKIIDESGQFMPGRFGVNGEMLFDPPRHLNALSPADRLSDLLLNTLWCFEIFGLMRRELAIRTPLHGVFYGADKVMLAYLLLMGRFAEIPEPLFFRRYHAGSSHGLGSAKAREAWIGAGTKKLVFPRVKCFAGYSAAIAKSDLPLKDKLACYGVLSKYTFQLRKWQKLLGINPASEAALNDTQSEDEISLADERMA